MRSMDTLAKILLIPTNQFFLILLVIVGYFSAYRAIFCRALFILLFTMILNTYLKSIWQIPLAPHLNKVGFAFPSGHMQTVVVFWGWLAIEFASLWFWALISLLWMSIAWALMHFGYHVFRDIAWAFVIAVLSLVVYYFLCKKFKTKKTGIIGLILIILSIPLLFLIPSVPPSSIGIAFGGLLGFTIGCLYSDDIYKASLKKQLLTIGVAILGAFLIVLIFKLLPKMLPLPYFEFIQFFILSLWISVGANFRNLRYAPFK